MAEAKAVYFHREVLIRSVEQRNIDMLTISSSDKLCSGEEDTIDPHLFPERHKRKRAAKFSHKKPIVLITARVHPGETPSSYTMQGILSFLTSRLDVRAMVLRRQFVFLLVPMLNPDGVYHGHYRMDTLTQNLNRYYIDPDVARQPSCYAVKKLLEHYSN